VISIRDLKLETRDSRLETRNSKFEARESLSEQCDRRTMRRLRVTWTSDSGVHLSHHLQDRCTVVHEIDVHVVTKYSEPPDTRYSKQLHTRHSILNNRYLTLDTSRFIRHSTSDIRYNPPPPSWMSCAWYMMNDERWRCTTPEKESLGRKPLRVESRKSHGTRVTSPHPAYAPRRVDSIRFDSRRFETIQFGSVRVLPSLSYSIPACAHRVAPIPTDVRTTTVFSRSGSASRSGSVTCSESPRLAAFTRAARLLLLGQDFSWCSLRELLLPSAQTMAATRARRSTLDARRSTLDARRSTLDACCWYYVGSTVVGWFMGCCLLVVDGGWQMVDWSELLWRTLSSPEP